MSWDELRFIDLLRMYLPERAHRQSEDVRELSDLLRREWHHAGPDRATMLELVSCFTEWMRRKGGLEQLRKDAHR